MDHTLIASTAISLVLGLISFVIGMRVAKERADRALLRQLYQDLYSHFRKIRDAARSGIPLQWTDFRKGDDYLPLVRSYERDGNLNLLPNKLARQLSDVENNALKFAHPFKNTVESELAPLLEKIIPDHLKDKNYNTSGKSYVAISIGSLALTQNFDEQTRSRFSNSDLGCGIDLAMERGRSKSLYLFPSNLRSGKIVDVFDNIASQIADKPEIKKAADDLKKAICGVDEILKKLSRRIKDPNPVLETLLEAWPDVFKRS